METVGHRSALSVAAASAYWRAGDGGRGGLGRRSREVRRERERERERERRKK